MRTPMALVASSLFAVALTASLPATSSHASENRSDAHQAYAEAVWKYVSHPGHEYQKWAAADDLVVSVGPTTNGEGKTFVKKAAGSGDFPEKSMIVREHLNDGKLTAISVWRRQGEGYSAQNDDWYWACYLPDGTVAATIGDRTFAKKPGFVTFEHDGRLWVFRCGRPELADFIAGGELAKHVIRPKAGPMGATLKAPDAETIALFLAAKPGFATILKDGRLWIFEEGSEEYKEMLAGGELAKHVIRPKAGPLGMTLKAPDSDTIVRYLASKPGFDVLVRDGRLWVFEKGSDEYKEMAAGGELAKHVIRPKAGPMGMTLKAPDSDIIARYIASQPGFEVDVVDGRIWVFKKGTEELQDYRKSGELAKHVIRPKAGPLGMTVKAPDAETMDAYLSAIK